MKSEQNDLYFRITAILFSVCCCAFKSLRAGAWYGKRFFIVQTAVSLISIGIGLLCAGGFVIRLLRKRRSPELHGSGDFHCKMICIFCTSML